MLGGIPGGLQLVVLVHWVSGVIWVPGGQVINCTSLGIPLGGVVSFLDMVLMPVVGWLVVVWKVVFWWFLGLLVVVGTWGEFGL